ncbi:hypothetical protein E2C01_091548 [Portunus trituberculatus]|uniref:Uncharacterized protein n=1 Tax=Portunus trituberculatus TaxID=210409 RepID=A0A5B7JT62_PORTR|nr:hypothetical protein [Portunus trituberculatus]
MKNENWRSQRNMVRSQRGRVRSQRGRGSIRSTKVPPVLDMIPGEVTAAGEVTPAQPRSQTAFTPHTSPWRKSERVRDVSGEVTSGVRSQGWVRPAIASPCLSQLGLTSQQGGGGCST